MSYLDIAFIALIVLFALIGVKRGFIKSVIGMFGWIVSLLIAFFCAKPLAEWLAGGVCKSIVSGDKSLYSFFAGKLPESIMTLQAGASAEQITAALGSGIFSALIKPFVGLFTSSEFMVSSATVGEGIALVLANAVFTLICGVVIFIVARILMSLFAHFANSAIDSSKTLTAANRFLGFLLGAARGALLACVLLFCASFFTGFSFMSGYNRELKKSTICAPVSECVASLPEKVLNDDSWFSDLLKNAGFGSDETDGTDESSGEETGGTDESSGEETGGTATVGGGTDAAVTDEAGENGVTDQ